MAHARTKKERRGNHRFINGMRNKIDRLIKTLITAMLLSWASALCYGQSIGISFMNLAPEGKSGFVSGHEYSCHLGHVKSGP